MPSTAHAAATAITVTNATDAVNGDTSSFDSLLQNPGPDGISVREAMLAANNMVGPKTIQFAAALKGATITVGSGNTKSYLPPLTSGSLTINGDIDGDGKPDVTLDGSLGTTTQALNPGLTIRSSGNTISGLRLRFATWVISLLCLDVACSPRSITANRIIANEITALADGDGVYIGTLGLTSTADAPALSDLVWDRTEVTGNTISVTGVGTGVFLVGGFSGSSRNRITNTRISGNHITGGASSVLLVGGDTNSAYDQQQKGLPVTFPIRYSDGNRFEDTLVSDNVLDGWQYTAITISPGKMGNQGNQNLRTHIIGNTIVGGRTNADGVEGIQVHVGASGGSERATSNNLVSDLEIRNNRMSSVTAGVRLSGGGKLSNEEAQAAGTSANRLQGVVVAGNTITLSTQKKQTSWPTLAGVKIWGGFSTSTPDTVSANVVSDVLITGNQIAFGGGGYVGDTTGVELDGGYSLLGTAQQNEISAVSITNNSFTSLTSGVRAVGGHGQTVTANRVTVAAMTGNVVDASVPDSLNIADEAGASGNSVTFPAPSAPLATPIPSVPPLTPSPVALATGTPTATPPTATTVASPSAPSSPAAAAVPTATVLPVAAVSSGNSPELGLLALLVATATVLAAAGFAIARRRRSTRPQ